MSIGLISTNGKKLELYHWKGGVGFSMCAVAKKDNSAEVEYINNLIFAFSYSELVTVCENKYKEIKISKNINASKNREADIMTFTLNESYISLESKLSNVKHVFEFELNDISKASKIMIDGELFIPSVYEVLYKFFKNSESTFNLYSDIYKLLNPDENNYQKKTYNNNNNSNTTNNNSESKGGWTKTDPKKQNNNYNNTGNINTASSITGAIKGENKNIPTIKDDEIPY